MYSTSDFRNGLKILIDTTPFEIVYFQHVKPGKGGAFVRTKLRNLINNNILEKTFRAGEKVGKPDLDEIEMQFLYADDQYHFMDTSSYEQVSLSAETLGDNKYYMKEGIAAQIVRFNGEVISVQVPSFVELTVAQCDPGVKGDTVSGATKPATLETGAEIQVPLFINTGDILRIDTRTKAYVERV